ncbi:hypothetical protein EDD70_0168 [Hydrogenoanaerobacterium saccharovorans]|uniref:Uncharacterized protein n=1 Tax=Hydrogenoanaerobacterium saccharovorans TaxID=474960 RepID=A0A1H8BIM9_9FIRM|nr:hypothetical protein [Hydrogenoanaerobacterium saccharovorans]RPF47388.1 hypothetical protein EDD70_0168 [Hydrogenoanaerobacterium saccharovorans]SEM82643.1 hypothetical protein SAMN05216180_1925 [Hydrogenoanaerobacterium saccharovorans]
MGLFNKKQKQQDYIALVRKTAEEAMPELKGWDMTLTASKSSAMSTFKKAGGYLLKNVAANVAASVVGLRVHFNENPFEEIMFITCFKGTDIYFLSIGDGLSKENLTIDNDMCFHFTGAEIQSLKKGFGKKVTLNLRDDGKFMFTYGVGAGTIYSIPEGDKQLESFIKLF